MLLDDKQVLFYELYFLLISAEIKMLIKIEQWFVDNKTGRVSLSQELDPENDTYLDHTPLELLLCLIKHQGESVTKDTMLEEVWPNKVVTEDVLSVAVSQIRKALKDNAKKQKNILKKSN